jgi:hypothetical protein
VRAAAIDKASRCAPPVNHFYHHRALDEARTNAKIALIDRSKEFGCHGEICLQLMLFVELLLVELSELNFKVLPP